MRSSDQRISSASSLIERLESRVLLAADATWIGINHGANDYQIASPAYPQATLIADMADTGVKIVRDGFAFGPIDSRTDTVVNNYVNAGISPHLIVHYRAQSGMEVSDYNQWLANYKSYCVTTMTRFKGKVFYYIVGNESDNSYVPVNYLDDPQKAVDFTRMAFEASRQVDPSGAIKIESTPVMRPDSSYLQSMINKGVTNYCDYVGVHCYGNQVNEYEIQKPWGYMHAANSQYGYAMKPLAASEVGIANGAPAGADLQTWRADWLDTAMSQFKRWGYSNVILFESTNTAGSNGGLENSYSLYRDNCGPIISTTYNEIKNNFTTAGLNDGDFEQSTNDYKRGWQVVRPSTDDNGWVNANLGSYNFYATGGRNGSHALKLDNGNTGWASTLGVRRTIGGLTAGQQYQVSCWVYSASDGSGHWNSATLEAAGYLANSGDTKVSASATSPDGWQQLTLTFTPTNTWVSLSLSAKNQAGYGGQCYVMFDDVAISTPSGLSTGFEATDIKPTWNDTSDQDYWNAGTNPKNVTGYNAGIAPECSIRTNEQTHGGNSALMFSGTANGGSADYIYYKVLDLSSNPLTIQSSTTLSYWLYPQTDNARYVAIDFHFTDGSNLRDSVAKDTKGNSLHPSSGHGGNIALNSWTQITSILGSYSSLVGKKVDRVWLAFDRGGATGQYRGYVDDLKITSNVATGGSASASSQPISGEGAAQAFDGNTGSKWLGNFSGSAWLQYQMPAPTIVKQYSITSANDDLGRDPKNWSLLASNDGINWVTLDTQSNQTFAGRYTTNTYSLSNTTAYSYYRLNITATSGGANLMQLSELQLLA